MKQILEAPMTTLSDEFLTPGTNKGIFYGGKFQKPNHSAVVKVLNPAKAQLFTTVPDATADDVQAAVSAARSAFASWSELDSLDRSRYLHKFANVLRTNIASLALLESTITGRSIREMNAQMARIPEWLEYFASIAIGLEGESNVVKGGYVTMTHYESLGPVALEPSCPDFG
jgi:acyl-CoA reductase-like NAD-dependent aldehyde dehydrogenase